MKKETVYFKSITQSKKGVVFCVDKPTASQVKSSKLGSQTVNFKLGGATVTGRKAFHNFGKQYFVQLDCTKLTKGQLPKVGDEFQIVPSEKPVINQQTGKPMTNLFWGYAG
tara:strand:- start:92 stop:424 length:333 start_codon:yes stop_codon:yes gene_type:complete